MLTAHTYLENVIDLTDQLHVSILDSIVHHLDIISRSNGPTVPRTGLFWLPRLGRTAHKNGLDKIVGFSGTARHERGPVAGTFFATGNAHAEKEEAFFFQFVVAPHLVGKPLVAAVDDAVARLEVWQKGLDGEIDGLARLDEQDNLAGRGELGAKVLRRVGADNGEIAFLLGSLDGRLDLGGRAVADADGEAVRGHVEGKVLAHDGQAVETDVAEVVVVVGHVAALCKLCDGNRRRLLRFVIERLRMNGSFSGRRRSIEDLPPTQSRFGFSRSGSGFEILSVGVRHPAGATGCHASSALLRSALQHQTPSSRP